MARQVYFAFHYQRDIWRVNVVRNSWVTRDREAAGFYDGSLWESAKKTGDEAIKRMINRGMDNTTVTAVLIGAETASRPWVIYEIQETCRRGNGLLAVRINGILNINRRTDMPGTNPFSVLFFNRNAQRTPLTSYYPTYNWTSQSGYYFFGDWVEAAARNAGR